LADRVSALIESDQQRGDASRPRWALRDDGGVESRLWNITRAGRGSGLPLDEAWTVIDRVVSDHPGGWEELYWMDREAAYTEFVDIWHKIRFDPNKHVLVQALEKANNVTLQTRNRPHP